MKRAMRAVWRRLQCERAELASSLLIFLAILGFFMLTVHAMFLYHGNNVVHAAAQDALVAGQIEGGNEAAAKQVAEDRLDLFPGLKNRQVTVDIDTDTNTVTVFVSAEIKTPFLVNALNTMESTAVGKIERFYEQDER